MVVVRKQAGSHDCLICGYDNKLGLQESFYEMENGYLVGKFKGRNEHQSYPKRMHGGMISAIIDETIGRTIWITERETWGVTVDLCIRFRKIVPLDEELLIVAKIIKNNHRAFDGKAIIINQKKEILAEGNARYLKMSLDKITDYHDEIVVYKNDDQKINEFDIDDIEF